MLTVAIPFLFLHERFQPELASRRSARRSIDIRLVGLCAVLVVVDRSRARHLEFGAGAPPRRPLALARRRSPPRLARVRGRFRPVSLDDAQFDDHLVSSLKLVEYALLAARRSAARPARRGSDARPRRGSCSGAPSQRRRARSSSSGSTSSARGMPGWRQPSFLGHHDLAALSALAAELSPSRGIVTGRRELPATGLFAVGSRQRGPRPRRSPAPSRPLAASQSVRSALWIAARHRFALVAAGIPRARGGSSRWSLAGVVAVRGDALEDFLRFVGLRGTTRRRASRRTRNARCSRTSAFASAQDNPIVGVGWQRSSRPEVFEPYVPDARERFPDVVDLAFPAEGREWGVQNLYIQLLADAGVIGLALLLARRGGGARARLAYGGTRTHTVGCRRRARRPLRAPHPRAGVGVARDRRRHPAAGCDVPPPRPRRSGRGDGRGGDQMSDAYLDPPRSMTTYAVRGPLVRWLREQARTRTALSARTACWTSAAA